MWLWIIIAVVAAILLFVTFSLLCRRWRLLQHSKTYQVRGERKHDREGMIPFHVALQAHDLGLDSRLVREVTSD